MSARHEIALEMVCGADFACKFTCGAGPGDLGGSPGSVPGENPGNTGPEVSGQTAFRYPGHPGKYTASARMMLDDSGARRHLLCPPSLLAGRCSSVLVIRLGSQGPGGDGRALLTAVAPRSFSKLRHRRKTRCSSGFCKPDKSQVKTKIR